jgi:hypothetical protein
MAYTMEQANALLAGINTEAELRNLISQLDVSANYNGQIDSGRELFKVCVGGTASNHGEGRMAA